MRHFTRDGYGWVTGSFTTCDRCPAEPMTRIATAYGLIELCWEHTREFTGWTAEELESRMAPYLDHLDEAKRRQAERDAALARRLG